MSLCSWSTTLIHVLAEHESYHNSFSKLVFHQFVCKIWGNHHGLTWIAVILMTLVVSTGATNIQSSFQSSGRNKLRRCFQAGTGLADIS